MDDIIFEKDYRETESAEYDKWCDEVFDRAVNGGMLKAYSEAMDKIPKIIVPEDKKNYEYLLERCDAFVKQHRGFIKGIVDYHRWHAEINMFLPFAEFDDSEDLAFLKEMRLTAYLKIRATEIFRIILGQAVQEMIWSIMLISVQKLKLKN